MPTLFYDQSKYLTVRAELTRKNDEFFHQYVLVSAVFVKNWTAFLSLPELQVMQFVLGRTLLYRKRAECISKSQMLLGIPAVCGPCGLSRNTIDKVVSGLSERNYLVLHAFREGSREQNSRIYELNTDKILAEHDVKEVGNMANRLPNSRVRPTPPNGVPLPQPVGDITLLLRNNISSTNVEESGALLPTPKKGRSKPAAINCTPEELVKSIANKATSTRDTRATKSKGVPARRWSTADIQALLDKAQQSVVESGYKVNRIVVVAKNIGVLHKRMLAAQIEDQLAFFTWVYENWATVASANRRSKSRETRDTQKVQGASMLTSPNFNDLAFRSPYLIAFYNQREQAEYHEQHTRKEEQKKVQTVSRSQANAIDERRRATREKDLQREKERREEESRPLRVSRRRGTEGAALDAPEFREQEWGQ